jgi:dTDP-4-amino-4,6-dideoxygalactose transaminase
MTGLGLQYSRLKNEIDQAVTDVMQRAQYINGPEVCVFAENLQKYLGVKHVIPCANGTDALQMALMALELKSGDEVITSAFSFIASAEAILLLGLTPVFADVERDTFNIDCTKIESLITPRTKALLPVHLFGQGADMNAVQAIAERHGLYVIEDVAQSLGSVFNIGGGMKKLGTIGDIGCTSFFPSKNLGCFGDGGACYTNSDAIAERLKMVGKHGAKVKYHHEIAGINSRLDTLQAAILNIKLKHLDEFITARINLANQYNKALKNIADVELPKTAGGTTHTYNQYTLKVKANMRDELQAFLKEKGIPTQVYYPMPLHQQKVFTDAADVKFHCPVSEQLCREALSLPVSTELKQPTIDYIINGVKSFW